MVDNFQYLFDSDSYMYTSFYTMLSTLDSISRIPDYGSHEFTGEADHQRIPISRGWDRDRDRVG